MVRRSEGIAHAGDAAEDADSRSIELTPEGRHPRLRAWMW